MTPGEMERMIQAAERLGRQLVARRVAEHVRVNGEVQVRRFHSPCYETVRVITRQQAQRPQFCCMQRMVAGNAVGDDTAQPFNWTQRCRTRYFH